MAPSAITLLHQACHQQPSLHICYSLCTHINLATQPNCFPCAIKFPVSTIENPLLQNNLPKPNSLCSLSWVLLQPTWGRSWAPALTPSIVYCFSPPGANCFSKTNSSSAGRRENAKMPPQSPSSLHTPTRCAAGAQEIYVR